jgi:transcriptional regulator with XRE-family HTH domain
MSSGRIVFGKYLYELMTSNRYSQKKVADKLGIDISLLSKIEHRERQVQGHMLKPIADLFKLNYKEIQIQILNQKIEADYGNEKFFNEVIMQIYETKIKQ